jgi:cobalt-zinc-cadmium efflux system protein
LAHDHSHGGHHHHHAHGAKPADFGWAFAVGIALNLGFVGVETA